MKNRNGLVCVSLILCGGGGQIVWIRRTVARGVTSTVMSPTREQIVRLSFVCNGLIWCDRVSVLVWSSGWSVYPKG